MDCPSHDRSVVDSPKLAAAETYATLQRALSDRTMSARSSARPTVIGEALRLSTRFAPASAAFAEGGIGTHMSSQISTTNRIPGTSTASKIRSEP